MRTAITFPFQSGVLVSVKRGEDQYHRLVVVTIKAPALRERKDDIPVLVEHFLKEIAPKLTANKEALAGLDSHDWPGNLKPLQARRPLLV